MTDRELFKQAFDGLHASEDTYEEVLMKIDDGRSPKGGMTRRALVLALAGALACGGTAYAIGSGLLAGAFGGMGRDDIPATVVDDDKGGTFIAPGMQFVEASDADVERILGGAVQHAGLSCEAQGYALTIDDLVVDGQGAGVATFTLTAPGGTSQFVGATDERYPDYGYLSLGPGAGTRLVDIVARGAGGEMFDHYQVVDLAQTTDDVLCGVMYFGAMEGMPVEGMTFGLVGEADDDASADGRAEDPSFWEVWTDAFVPGACAESVELTDGQGHTAHVSPIAITYAAPFGEGGDSSEGDCWVPHNTAIQFADGLEYTVEDGDELLNTYCGYYTMDGAMTLVFNRLVDPGQVVGVTVDGPNGTVLAFSR